MTRAPTCCAPGTEVKGVRERDENKTGSDRRIFFSGGWLHLWQYTSYKREEENLGGRDLDLHTTDSHCENVTHTQSERASERVSEWASERAHEAWNYRRARWCNDGKSAAHCHSWGRRSTRVLRLNHEIANNPLSSLWPCDVVFRMPTCNWRILV